MFIEQRTKYHIDPVVRETGGIADNGLDIVLVNTAINDGSDTAQLMSCMLKKEVNDPKFPVLSSEVERLKTTEGGTDSVCEVMQFYEDEAREEGLAEGRAEGRAQGGLLKLMELVSSGLLTIEQAAGNCRMSVPEFTSRMEKGLF